MIEAEAIIWGLAAATVTGLGYLQARKSGAHTEDEDATPGAPWAWLGLTHRVVVALFGHRYWTVRGLSTTTGLCAAIYGLALLINWDAMHFGQSGYPTIAALVVGFLATLPFLVHLQIQVMRRCLEFASVTGTTWKRNVIPCLLVAIPIGLTIVSLLPVAIVAGMVDSQSFIPKSVIANWVGISRMLLWDWAQPEASGLITVVGIMLNGPAVMWCLYLSSWGSGLALRHFLGPTSPWCTRLEKHPIAVVGGLHASYTFLFVQGIMARLNG